VRRLLPFSGVLRHRDFRLLWIATSTSAIGDRIVTVALALFVIDLTGSATDVGLVLAANAIPLVALVLVGGVWADRLPRHRVIVVTDLVRFALHALLAALILSGAVAVWHVVAIEMLFGAAEAFYQPAASGLVPQTVPEREIQGANALTRTSENVAEFVGPALATALVLGASAGAAFALDAATFLVSAACVVRIRPRRRAVPVEAPAAPGMGNELRAGFREVRSRAWIWATLVAFCVAVFAAFAPWFVLGPSVAREQYGGIGVFGIVSAAFGAGTIAGALLGLSWRPRHPMRMAMAFAVLWPLSTILYALGVTLYLVLPATVVAGTGIALFDVWWLTALAERLPPDKLSRVTAYDWLVSLALLPLGYLLAGPLASALGAVTVLLAGSILATIALALGLLPRETRSLERIDDADAGTPVPEQRPGLPVA
jgi:MFS family permease